MIIIANYLKIHLANNLPRRRHDQLKLGSSVLAQSVVLVIFDSPYIPNYTVIILDKKSTGLADLSEFFRSLVLFRVCDSSYFTNINIHDEQHTNEKTIRTISFQMKGDNSSMLKTLIQN